MTESWEKYNSNETGAYVRFLLWLGCKDTCERCHNNWRFGRSYPSDGMKHFGFKRRGLEGFF